MKIINNREEFRIIDLLNQYDDLYFEGLNISAHPYRNSLVIIDLANAMQSGKTCTRWLFSVSPWKMDTDRLCMAEYVEMSAPECDTLAELVAWLRAGKPMREVDGLTISAGTQPGNRTFSPFAPVKPVKLGDRLNAGTIAKAISTRLQTLDVERSTCRRSRRTSTRTRAAGASGGMTRPGARSSRLATRSIIKRFL